MSTITIENLTKDYGNNKGVFNISFEIKKGEVYGFLGPNGSGKTTTIRNLMGFIKPDGGKCLITGLNTFNDREKIQKNVGYIPGEIAFINDMTGLQFIDFIAKYRGLHDLTRANELIKMFELDPTNRIKKMSKGTKQKIGIVVAFMHNPDIIILDEPTSGLDPIMQNTFIKLIREEKNKGKTILMSSHMFEEVEKTCDKVTILKEGKIIATDTIDNLRKTKQKKYILTFKNVKDIDKFKKENIKIVDIIDDKVTIIVQENFKLFIELLSKYNIIDLSEETQGLEDVFMHYYGGE